MKLDHEARENTWWILVPRCTPLAIPVDLAAKAHDDGRYTIFLGTYVQAYAVCNPPRGESEAKAPPPIAEIRQVGPPRRETPARFAAPPKRSGPASYRDEWKNGMPAGFTLKGPPARPKPVPLPADQVNPDAAMIERMRQRIAKDGLTMPEVLESVRQDLCKTIDRYEQARASGEDMEFPRNRLLAGKAILIAMEGF